MIDLGGGISGASGINDIGQVVGSYYSYIGNVQSHAFITGPDGAGLTDLGSVANPPAGFTYHFSSAAAINNHGQVAAVGEVQAVPEPEMYAMLLSGLGLISFLERGRATAEEFTIPSIKANVPRVASLSSHVIFARTNCRLLKLEHKKALSFRPTYAKFPLRNLPFWAMAILAQRRRVSECRGSYVGEALMHHLAPAWLATELP